MEHIGKALPWVAFWIFMAVSVYNKGPTVEITMQKEPVKAGVIEP